MTTIKIPNGNATVNEGVLSGSELDVGNGNNTVTLLDGSTNDVIDLGGGNGTLNANGLSHSTITASNGKNTINANGDGNTITVGSGSNTITALGNGDVITVGNGSSTITTGANANITIGDGNDIIVAGRNSTIGPGSHKDNGNDTVTAGPSSRITLGDGNNTVFAGSDSTVVVGNGTATIHAGTNDTITLGNGADRIVFDGLTPQFTIPTSLTVPEEGSIALPITLGPAALGHEVVIGFRPNQDVIVLDTSDFANFDAVKADAKQVGADTVISLDPLDSITLQGVALSSLSAGNFQFGSGAAADTITVTGIPSDAKLSAGTNNGGGSWTLTPAQLAGLQLDVGEPIGYPTAVDLKVTATNPTGQSASASHDVGLTVQALPPTVHVSYLPALPGDPATETRLQITATTDDPDGGADYIKRLELGNLPSDVTVTDSLGLLSGRTIGTTGKPGTFTDEVDVFAPAGKTTNFDLGVTAFSDEPNSAEVSASQNQNIEVDFKTSKSSTTFTTDNQSIWDSGDAFAFKYDKFFGVSTTVSGGTSLKVPPVDLGLVTIPGFTAYDASASLTLKAGFQADLSLQSGSFNATLPFDISLSDTYNPHNQTLTVDPTATQGAGGTISTTGPGGSFEFGLVLDAMEKVFLKILGDTLVNSNEHTGGGLPDNLVSLSTGESTSVSITLPAIPPIPPTVLATLTFAWPTIDTSGTGANTAGTHTIESNGISNDVFNISVDPIRLALAEFGSNPNFFDFTVPLKTGKLTVNLASLMVDAGLAMSQTFDLNASLQTGTLTPTGGTPQTLTFGTPLTLYNSPDSFSLSLDPTSTLKNDTQLNPTLGYDLTALELTNTYLYSFTLGPLLSLHQHTTLPGVSVYDKTFPVTFAPQTIAVA